MLFQIHSWRDGIKPLRQFLCWNFLNFTEQNRRISTYLQKDNRIMWNEEQDNRHQIRVNKGEPQPPLENDGRKNKTRWRSHFPFWCAKTETKSVWQGYVSKSWEWKNSRFSKGWVSWMVINGSGNKHPSVLKEVFSDGKSRGNSQKEILFFLRSSGKSISKIKLQREQHKTEDKNMTIQNKAMRMLAGLKGAGISYKEFAQKTGISLD